MDIQSLVLIAALFANISLVLLLLEQAKKSVSIAVFTVSVGTVAAWTFAMFLYRSMDEEQVLLFGRLLYASAMLIPLTFLYFSFLFPAVKSTIAKEKVILLALPPILLGVLIFFTDYVVYTVLIHPGAENEILFGPLYLLYIAYVSCYFVWALFNLWQKYLGATGLLKTQLSYILTGTLISIVFGSTFNLFLPSIGDFRLNWLGNVMTLIMVSFIAYAIIKRQLFGIRVVLTQLLVGVIAILLLINIFNSKEPFEYFWKGGLLIAFLIAGYLLVKSVMNEIKIREDLEHAYEKLKELDEAKSEFVSIASHQLRTPLTAIKGYISMLTEGTYGKLSLKQVKPMQNIYQSNERLITLVNDLLNISRIESGRVKVELQKAKLENIIQDALSELQIKAKEKKLKIILLKPEPPLPLLLIDPAKLRNILLNILDNAIKYTKKGSITVTITPIPKNRNLETKNVLIGIKDTGEGMSKQELLHLFESFSRGKAGNKMWTEGAGLGLYIAKKFVEMHKGKIWAESEGKEKGSTFFVELPIN